MIAGATVALAQTGFAMAPTIEDPGDIVIGDIENGTSSNDFNYPDAFDLEAIGSDDSLTPDQIIWSYYVADTYTVNGVPSLASPSIAGAINPAAGEQVQANDLDTGNPGQDAFARTVTFRNTFLSPQGGPNVDPGPGCALSSQTRTLTLFASDGTTAAFETIVVYTCDDTTDSISSGLALIRDDAFPNAITGWFGAVQAGTATFDTTSLGGGLCMGTALAGTNAVGWAFFGGAFGGYVQLVPGNVWMIRTHVSSDRTTGTNNQPIFDTVYDNTTQFFDGVTYQFIEGLTYAGEFVTVDNEGGANSIGKSQGRTYMDHYVSPIAMQLPQWNGTIDQGNSAFATAVDDSNDWNLTYRLLDTDPNLISSARDGTYCISRIQIYGGALDSLRGGGSVEFAPPINSTTHFATNIGGPGGQNLIDDANAWVDMQMTTDTSAGSNGSAKRIGIFDVAAFGSGTTAELNAALYPVQYTANTLYLLTSKMESRVAAGQDATTPSGTASNSPVDIINMVAFQPSLDCLESTLVFSGAGGNMPCAGTPRNPTSVGGADQEYVSLFYTNNLSLTGLPNGIAFAPQLQFFTNNPAFPAPGNDPFRVLTLGVENLGQTSPAAN